MTGASTRASRVEPIEPPQSANAGSPVPEPGTLLLVGTGLVGVAFAARRRRSAEQ